MLLGSGCEAGPGSPPPPAVLSLPGGGPELWDLLGRGKGDVPRLYHCVPPAGGDMRRLPVASAPSGSLKPPSDKTWRYSPA